MKKIILLLVLFTAVSHAQVVNIPDANFKNKLVSGTCVDTDGDGVADASADLNDDGEIQVAEALTVNVLFVNSAEISDLTGIEFFTNLSFLSCRQNELTSLDVSTLTNLIKLYCNNNQLTSLDVSALTNLNSLGCSNNQLASLDVSTLTNLNNLDCSNNQLTTLDFSGNPIFNGLICSNNNLIYVNIKNGFEMNDLDLTSWSPNPNLSHLCIDNSELEFVSSYLPQTDFPFVTINDYCSFTPGGDYNTITGNIRYDLNNDGCDTSDFPLEYLKVNINDTSQTGSTFTNNSGDYRFYTQAGNFTITPVVENPSYFSFSPLNATLNFPLVDNSVQTQDFCVTANGIHRDLEVTFVPIGNARPGFNAQYKLVFKNKGNQTLSGNITLNYDSNKLNFISTFPDDNFELNVNQILWNYSNLLPFETRTIDLVLRVIAPPTVNNGDILNFTTTINPTLADETLLDNIFEFNQTVVNSYDPNQIQCLEGNTIAPEDLGKYLHYNIDFENVGTADAVNVVVKSTIDTEKYNLNSLQLQYASHNVETKVTGNIVEFIFKNIHLPPSNGPIGGHGNVLFKIKTQPDLVIGDEVMGSASIFFDYNAPIDTNEARTVIASLKNPSFIQDKSIQIAPNPAKDKLNISAKGIIKSIQLFDAQGRILQTILEHKKTTTLDISDKANGVYFVKVMTENGGEVQKILKEN